MNTRLKELITVDGINSIFPSTRFQGSKLKLVDWIWDAIKEYEFHSALDAFGGTGSVAYMLKAKGKQVTYNDILKFNWFIGLALIENDHEILSENEIEYIITKHRGVKYPSFVYETFKNIYFTEDENEWVDMVSTNINSLGNNYKKAIAYFALFQACIIKRPYNLFHRKNLYVRLSDVERNFGNKTTWDTSFDVHFIKFAKEANRAVFMNNQHNQAFNFNVFDIVGHFDLVYIDTPYISQNGVGVDYLGFYHFLEGLVNYERWGRMIDYETKHKKLKSNGSVWTNKNEIFLAFDKLFDKFKESILVVSYRSDGIPTVEELEKLLKKYKKNIIEVKRREYRYALSSNRSEEIIFIGS